MIINGLDTGVAAAQLRILFDIVAIFRRRGQKVASFENAADLLFDARPYNYFEKYYPPFHSSSFRRILGLIANSASGLTLDELKSECSDLSEEKITENIEKATTLQLLTSANGKHKPTKPVGFGTTFEWYTAAVCTQELACIAYWGVKVENLTGDYDVVLIRENQIGYIECKSGKMSQISRSDIKNYLKRERILAPQFSIFLVDGISRDNLNSLVGYALEENLEYEFEMPGVMTTQVTLASEIYRNFVRLIPINSFFVTVDKPIASIVTEIFEFLTLVCDRSLPTENMAAKTKFR